MFENHFKRHDLGPNFHEINYDGTIQARNNFANASSSTRRSIIAFLNTLILFPPDDTSSNLEAANSDTPGYPQFGHGSIRLGALFNNPNDPE